MAQFWLEDGVLKSNESLYNFDEYQQYEIEFGIKSGLTNEQINIYAKPEFYWDQMKEIRTGLEQGLDVSVYAKPEFNYDKMYEIHSFLKQGFDISSYINFYGKQLKEIRLGLEQNLDVSIYAKPEFNNYQMEQIREDLESGLTPEQVSIYANLDIYEREREDLFKSIHKCLEQGLDISLCLNPNFNPDQKLQILKGIYNHFSPEQIAIFAKPEFEAEQMQEIRLLLSNKNISNEFIALYIDPKFNSYELSQIRFGLEDNLTPEQIAIYAKPEFDYHQMYELRKSLEAGIDVEKVKMYANPAIDSYKMSLYRKCFAVGLDTPINEEFRDIKNRKEIFQKIEDNVYAYLTAYDDENISPYNIQVTSSDIYYCGEHWMTMNEFKELYFECIESGEMYRGIEDLDFEELDCTSNEQNLENHEEDHELIE